MNINTNIGAMGSLAAIRTCFMSSGLAMERLSSGLKINRGVDDPCGLAISKGMEAQIRGGNVAATNIQDGINLLRTQEGGLLEILDLLKRARDLSVRAANEATLSAADLARIDSEIKSIIDGVDQIAESTTFNTKHVLLGNPVTTSSDLEFEVIWWVANVDLDIHIIQPDGAHAWYANLNPTGNGEIDIDDTNGSSGPADPAVEHYNVASGAALPGDYELWINYYSGGVMHPNVTATVTVSMYRGTAFEDIQTFNVNVPYQANNAPWGGNDAVGPYGEVFVGSYSWSPLATASTADFQIGADNKGCFTFEHEFFESRSGALGIGTVSAASSAAAAASIDSLDSGIQTVLNYLATIGEREMRLNYALDDLKTSIINLTAANSRIEDADIAVEASILAKANILGQMSTQALDDSYAISKSALDLLNQSL